MSTETKSSGNNLQELNSILFAQLRRLNDATPAQLDEEIKRASMITDVAKPIISGASLVLQAQKLKFEALGGFKELPNMLEVKND